MHAEDCALYIGIIVLVVLLVLYLYLVNGQRALRAVCAAVIVIAALLWAWSIASTASYISQAFAHDYFLSVIWVILLIGVIMLAAVVVAVLVPQSWW